VIFYHTPYGYWIRASGRKPAALEASGRNPKLVQFSAFVISGVLCGVAGAHLSIGYLSLFALSIIAGRGFIALAIIFFANAKPSVILGASIIFGAAEALTPRIPVEVMPPQASLMLPYIITILTITFFGAQKRQE
jgi:simple sugar transport system permease protein